MTSAQMILLAAARTYGQYEREGKSPHATAAAGDILLSAARILWAEENPELPDEDPDPECYRGGEYAAHQAAEQARIQRDLK